MKSVVIQFQEPVAMEILKKLLLDNIDELDPESHAYKVAFETLTQIEKQELGE